MINWSSYLRRNVGPLDQGLRALAGALVTWLAWFDGNDRWVLIGVVILLTSMFRFCPTYALFRFNTLKQTQSRQVVSWEEFLDKNGRRASHPVIEEPAPLPAPKPTSAQPTSSFTIPEDLKHQLIEDIQNNTLDEMLVLRFYENFFDCRISIIQQHIHTYRCDFQSNSQTYGFAELKAQLLDKLLETSETRF